MNDLNFHVYETYCFQLIVCSLVCITVRMFKYTRAPQTVHNTPVMNILKGYFIRYFSKRNALKKPSESKILIFS